MGLPLANALSWLAKRAGDINESTVFELDCPVEICERLLVPVQRRRVDRKRGAISIARWEGTEVINRLAVVSPTVGGQGECQRADDQTL